MASLETELSKRRTFAIISHPDAGKTTITEKLLLFGGAIKMAGSVKGRKAARMATSDWMKMEQERGISVTSSVMQFPYKDKILNLLDTPGHADFSEDTYRVLTAVDSALMVVDAAKGVEERTIKLMEICRMRATPIITFVNKMDREGQDTIALLDEIETVLKIKCAPITWPLGMGKNFKGVYHLLEDKYYLYAAGKNFETGTQEVIAGFDSPKIEAAVGKELVNEFKEELELVQGASNEFSVEQYLQGKLTPVFFGSALTNFGVKELLNAFVEFAPAPKAHAADSREVAANEEKFSGFVFKIQANMDPNHRDRIAFMRVCSGKFEQGMKLFHVRAKRTQAINSALTFMAGEREQITTACSGDIIGLHNHGTIKIGDTFTEGEELKFTGIPNFAPELFKLVRAVDPLKAKQLHTGLVQLSEEGATQVFRPLNNNNIILGAVGTLQFDVVAQRLKHEYKVECIYETVQVNTARWVICKDKKMLDDFTKKNSVNLAYDAAGLLSYLAPTRVNLNLTMERWPKVEFVATREH